MKYQENHPERFIRVPVAIADGSLGLSPTQIYTYLALAHTARNVNAKNMPRFVKWEPRHLARAVGVSVRSLPLIIDTLEERGLFRRERASEGVVLDADLAPGSWVKVPATTLWTEKPHLHGDTATLAVAGQEDRVWGGTPRLSPEALRALFGLVLTQDWKTGEVTFSAEYIASRAGMSKCRYHLGLKTLTTLGLVEKEEAVFVRTGAQVRRKRVNLQLRLDALEWSVADDAATDVTSTFVRQSRKETRAKASAARRERRQSVQDALKTASTPAPAPVQPAEPVTVSEPAPLAVVPEVVVTPVRPKVDPGARAKMQQYLGESLYARVGAALDAFTDADERRAAARRLTKTADEAINRAAVSDLQFQVTLREYLEASNGDDLLVSVERALAAMQPVAY